MSSLPSGPVARRPKCLGVSVGTHRRVLRQELDTYIHGSDPPPRREALRSLWLNRAIAGRLARDPERVLAKARSNLVRFRRLHARGTARRWLEEWEGLIDEGPDSVMRILVAETPHAADLRQNSPFAGVLSQGERRRILDAFVRNWRPRAA